MDWIDQLNACLDYVEEHLTDEVDPAALANIACCSVFQFQRIFTCLAKVPLGEYVRRRRMTQAALELGRGAKVLDTALKYGYDSPTAFNRAFQQVHGIPPSFARRQAVKLKSYPPIRFRIIIQGEVEMNYRIETKEAFTVLGVERTFQHETAFADIPPFWDEFFAQGHGKTVMGEMGICVDENKSGPSFTYLIADRCAPDAAVPQGFTKLTIPTLTWAVFEGQGALPDALQRLNRRIWEEWFPASKDYTFGPGYNVELYIHGDMDSEDYCFEIWIPVVAK